jgi:signal transduction histidine kinase
MSAIPLDPLDQAAAATSRVMVVDDMPENLALIKNMLKDKSFEIFAFPNGQLALNAALRVNPDLILLDITMPDMDGYETCARLKSDSRLQEIPVIFLSALTDTADKIKGFRAGAVDFISKPFEVEEVHVRVMTHINLRTLQRRLQYQNLHLQKLVDEKVAEISDAHRQSRKRLAEIAHMNRLVTSSVLSAAIAHELRQPLAAILSNTEAAELYLQREPPEIAPIREILADICRDNHRASNIIERMRNLLNAKEAKVEECDLNEIVRDVLLFLTEEAKMRGVTIATEHKAVLQIVGDRVQLQQVLINLLLNSMDAMADLPVSLRHVLIKTSKVEPMMAEIMVTDRGIGFHGNIDDAFQSFFTTKPHGTGMGLSITASLIDAHGGRIWAENRIDGGAVVRFTLPLHTGDPR